MCTATEFSQLIISSQFLEVAVGQATMPTGYGPRIPVKKLRVAWTVSGMNMAASHEKIFANVPQLTSKKDWLVWKFQCNTR